MRDLLNAPATDQGEAYILMLLQAGTDEIKLSELTQFFPPLVESLLLIMSKSDYPRTHGLEAMKTLLSIVDRIYLTGGSSHI